MIREPEPCSEHRLADFEAAARSTYVCWPPTHRLPTQEELLWLVQQAREAALMRVGLQAVLAKVDALRDSVSQPRAGS